MAYIDTFYSNACVCDLPLVRDLPDDADDVLRRAWGYAKQEREQKCSVICPFTQPCSIAKEEDESNFDYAQRCKQANKADDKVPDITLDLTDIEGEIDMASSNW